MARRNRFGTWRTDSSLRELSLRTILLIPMERFDNPEYIDDRLNTAPKSVRGALKTALRFLYETNGPVNLPRARLKAAEPLLDSAEAVVARWLFNRTRGGLRTAYGANALRQARIQRYRCEHCGHADVRVLNLDHVEGKKNRNSFACLCSNCHVLKSREKDWIGLSGAREYMEEANPADEADTEAAVDRQQRSASNEGRVPHPAQRVGRL